MIKKKILFICGQNSGRSQMAEALLRKLAGDKYEVYSAGTQPSSVNPHAVRVMEEIGIDMSRHWSKSVDEFLDKDLDFVVTVCDKAKEECPYFPGGREHLHHSFSTTSANDTEEKMLIGLRKVRDEIEDWLKETF